MFVDPDQNLTREQLYEKVWHGLPPEAQAIIEAYGKQEGLSRHEVMQQRMDRYHDPVEGPALVASLEAHVDRLAHPFGRDPKVMR